MPLVVFSPRGGFLEALRGACRQDGKVEERLTLPNQRGGVHSVRVETTYPVTPMMPSYERVERESPNKKSGHQTKRVAQVVVGGEDAETTLAAERLGHRYGFRVAKRAFDILFSALVLVLLCWVYAIVAIAIKFDDPHGPVFFRQQRVGKDGKRFTMWKFRSMYADAEERFEALRAYNEKDGPVFKIKDDPRITRVGRFIRKTSLDEMPQFWNILRGDMSIVGPRPALPREVAEYTPRQRQRLLVKPGVTCYWQTRRNRDDISFDEWVDLDLLYIRNCSVWSDIKLIIQTIGVVLTAQGE